MRESPNYRDALARLDERFPNREFLSIKDCMDLTGHSYRWCTNHLPLGKLGISKVQLAKLM